MEVFGAPSELEEEIKCAEEKSEQPEVDVYLNSDIFIHQVLGYDDGCYGFLNTRFCLPSSRPIYEPWLILNQWGQPGLFDFENYMKYYWMI